MKGNIAENQQQEFGQLLEKIASINSEKDECLESRVLICDDSKGRELMNILLFMKDPCDKRKGD